jgi:hypothetical protein
MREIPSKNAVVALTDAARAVAPALMFGVARTLADGRVSVWFSHTNGLGEYIVPRALVPAVLLPDGEPQDADGAAVLAAGQGPVEWLLNYEGMKRVAAARMTGTECPASVWLALSSAEPLTGEQHARLRAFGESAANLLAIPPSADEAITRLKRLDSSAQLLPDLLHVLDVQEVFDRLAAIAKHALPHDLLLLRLISDDLSSVSIFARSDRGTDLGPWVPNPYPAMVTNAWQFDIVDDLQGSPFEVGKPPATLGARGCLRIPIRFDNHVIGGVGFLSFTPGNYTIDDVFTGICSPDSPVGSSLFVTPRCSSSSSLRRTSVRAMSSASSAATRSASARCTSCSEMALSA